MGVCKVAVKEPGLLDVVPDYILRYRGSMKWIECSLQGNKIQIYSI